MTPTSTTERGERSRRHILSVAAKCFAERGYAGTSLTDVLGKVDLTKGAFYFHFDSKEELALAVFEDQLDSWRRVALAVLEAHERAIDRLLALPIALAELYARQPGMGSLTKLAGDLADSSRLARLCDARTSEWIESVRSLIVQAQQEGDVHLDLDAGSAAEVAVAAFVGAEQLSQQSSDYKDLPERAARLVYVLGRALQPA